jgi:PAS domain S-box-containing protein
MAGNTRRLVRYGVAVLALAAAIVLRCLLNPVLGEQQPLTLLYAAVAVAVWHGGLGPALLTAALGYLAADLLFIADPHGPRGLLAVGGWAQLVGLFTYVLTCSLIVASRHGVQMARHLARGIRGAAELGSELDDWQARMADEAGRRRAAEDRVRQLEADLQRRVAELQTIMDVMPIGLAVAHDKECRDITINPSFAEMVGLPGFPIGHRRRTDADALPIAVSSQGQELDVEMLPMQRAAASGTAVLDVELDVRTRDGDVVHLLVNAVPLFDEQGQVRGCIGTHVDITERKRAAQALHAANQRLHDVLSSITDGYFAVDQEFRFLEINPAAHRLVFNDRPIEELLGNCLWDLYPEGRSSDFYTRYRQAMRERTPLHFEARSHIVDRWFEIHAYPRNGRLEVYLRDITERRRMEQALRASERDFRALFELAATGSSQADARTGRFVRVNQRFCEITGYGEAELLERTFLDITHPDDRERDRAMTDRVRRGEQDAWEIEKRYVRKDGQIVWVLVAGRMILDHEGRPFRTAAHILDITDRKQAEQALRRSEARYRALVEAASSVVWTWHPDLRPGEYDKMQAWWEELTGQSPEEQAGTGWLAVVHPDDRARAAAAWSSAFTSGATYESEYRLRTRTGTYRHMLARAVPIREPGGAMREWVGMMADLTEQQRAKEALRYSEEQLRLIIDSVPALIAYIDSTHRYRLANRSYERWFGLSPEQIRGQHARTVLDEAAWQAVYPYMERALAGEEVTYEQELVYREVGRRWVRGTYTPHRDPHGRVRGFAVLVNDITERKQAEDALKEADRRKDEFLATLAHELRNPLAPIRSSLQILKMPGADAAVQERARETMERQLHHLVRLVDDLLDVSRIMRGKIELRRDVVALDAVIARALEAAQPLLDAQRHTLSVSLPAEPVELDADPIRLAQVVSNLLTNAAKYTEPGGHVWLSAERSGDEVILRVRDDGIGIAPEMLSCIFDLFVQVDSSTARSQGGLGIGLTLVKSLVELHQGSVEARSDGLGKGAELIVRLPVLPRAQTGAGVQGRVDENTPAPSTRCRVLVVDDNTDAGETLAMLLNLYGYEVEVVASGAAALEKAQAFRPEVIFLDIGMPGMDGYEVARRLRGEPWGQQVRLVALTGWGQAEDRRRTREAGFDHHFTKPVDPKAVRELLVSITGG